MTDAAWGYEKSGECMQIPDKGIFFAVCTVLCNQFAVRSFTGAAKFEFFHGSVISLRHPSMI